MKGFKWLIICLLIIGIFFRFINIDKKVFWGDESSTLVRISGYTFQELRQQFSKSYQVNLEDLQKYQQLNTNKSSLDVIKNLAIEEPQLPPSYFLLLRSWVQLFGNSVISSRSFSAFISLFALPAIYWLCRELFPSSGTAWMAMGLLAISPFHVLYAQEARPQSFWTVTILLSSAALLKAMRQGTKQSWIIYSFTLTISLYTYFFSCLVAIGHGLYILIQEGFQFTKTLRAYLLSSLLSILLFSPWLIVIFNNFFKLNQETSWAKSPVLLDDLIKTWFLNLSRLFLDVNYNLITRDNLLYLSIVGIAVLIAYSIYFLCHQTPQKTWLFVVILIGVTALALLLPDLVAGGRRSSIARYLIPCFLGIQLSVAYCLSQHIFFVASRVWQQQLWKMITVSLFSVGIISCAFSSQANIWWSKYNCIYLPNASKVINQASKPILISSGYPPLDLAYLLKANVIIQSPDQGIPCETNDIFVLSRNYSSGFLKDILQQAKNCHVSQSSVWKGKVEPTFETKIMLWKLNASPLKTKQALTRIAD